MGGRHARITNSMNAKPSPAEALVHEIRNALIPLTVDLRRKEATMEQVAATVDRLLDFVDGIAKDLRAGRLMGPSGQIVTVGRITTINNWPQEVAEYFEIETTSGILIAMSDDDVRAAAGMLGKTIEILEVAP